MKSCLLCTCINHTYIFLRCLYSTCICRLCVVYCAKFVFLLHFMYNSLLYHTVTSIDVLYIRYCLPHPLACSEMCVAAIEQHVSFPELTDICRYERSIAGTHLSWYCYNTGMPCFTVSLARSLRIVHWCITYI